MYYRLHVSVIKYLMSREGSKADIPFDVLDTFVRQAAEGPFATHQEHRGVGGRGGAADKMKLEQ